MGNIQHEENSFVWRQGRTTVSVEYQRTAWVVTYISASRLIGPSRVLYQERHQNPKNAAWDVMARVIRATRDEDLAIEVARAAARWMRQTMARQSNAE